MRGIKVPGEKRFAPAVRELKDAVRFEFGNNRVGPGLILLYSGTDVLASLTRPREKKSSMGIGGKLYVEWVDKYVLQGSSLRCTADEMWGYRCGLLHCLTAESDVSRRRNNPVRHINHVGGDSAAADEWQRYSDREGHKDTDVWISIGALEAAFGDGCDQFVRDVESDSELAVGVYEHAKYLLWQGELGRPPA